MRSAPPHEDDDLRGPRDTGGRAPRMNASSSVSRKSLEKRLEIAAERLLSSPDLGFTEIDLTPCLRLVRASDAPSMRREPDPSYCLPYIYRSEWFFLVSTEVHQNQAIQAS